MNLNLQRQSMFEYSVRDELKYLLKIRLKQILEREPTEVEVWTEYMRILNLAADQIYKEVLEHEYRKSASEYEFREVSEGAN